MTDVAPVVAAEFAAIVSKPVLEPTKRFMREQGIRKGNNTAVLVHRAIERGVAVTAGAGARADMAFEGRTAWFRAGNSSLNTALTKRMVNNKDVLSRYLRSRGVRAPQNAVFSHRELHRAWAWARPITPVVVKPPQGKLGRQVHVDIDNYDEFARAFTAVTEAEGQALVEQFARGVDHRLTVVGGKVAAATRRFPPHVIGDGVSDIATLVEEKNEERRRRADPVHKQLSLGDMEQHYLELHGFSAKSVPAMGQPVQLRGAANVDTGGDAVDATATLRPQEIAYVEHAADQLPGLGLGGFDVLLDREGDEKPWILEINASPVISPHYFPWEGEPRDVAGLILEAMFPSLRRRPRPIAARPRSSPSQPGSSS